MALFPPRESDRAPLYTRESLGGSCLNFINYKSSVQLYTLLFSSVQLYTLLFRCLFVPLLSAALISSATIV